MTRARFSISPMRALIRRPIALQPGYQVSNPGITFEVTTSFSYAPLFPGVTVAGVFPTPIMKTSMMRLN